MLRYSYILIKKNNYEVFCVILFIKVYLYMIIDVRIGPVAFKYF